MSNCLICKEPTPIEPFISFGKMPIANGFLGPLDFDKEYFFEMEVGFCSKCCMVQLLSQPDPEQMFHDNYAFFSSTSVRMAEHFRVISDTIRRDYLSDQDPFVVEIGTNDGIFLQNFAKANIRHLGVEPSANVAAVANQKGVHTLCRFFNLETANEIVAKQGQADVFFGANVMCHILDIHSVAEGIARLLKPNGVLIFEDPYLGDIIEKTSYDQIYDEHAFYFSIASVNNLFQQYGMHIVDVAPQSVHGGSMRYVLAHRAANRQVTDAVRLQVDEEARLGLQNPSTFQKFRQNVERSREELVKLLQAIRDQGKRVVGYAATSKSTTITNYCQLDSELVEFISDTTPLKQGKFSPGMHIPVRSHADFSQNYPDFALLFGWNHAQEIMAKEQAFVQRGGKWIVYVPEVKVIA